MENLRLKCLVESQKSTIDNTKPKLEEVQRVTEDPETLQVKILNQEFQLKRLEAVSQSLVLENQQLKRNIFRY